jgi:hypothetical protein
MTEKQESQFRKLIEYVQELARQHNEVERRVEELEAKVNKPADVGPTSR